MLISDWCSDVCSSDLRHRAAVLGPGGFIGTGRFGAFLAVADRADPRFRHAKRDEIVLGGVGATFAQRQVVIAGAAFVGMPLNRDANIRIGHPPLRLALPSRLIFCAAVDRKSGGSVKSV